MAKKQPAESSGDEPTDRYGVQSTLAVSKEIADRIREVAKSSGSTTLDVTNKLLDYALDHAEIEIEVKTMKISPRDMAKKTTPVVRRK
jgi:hypothetical protein